MRKFRIIERKHKDGSTSYMPQERCCFLWFDCYRRYVEMNLIQAEEYVKSEESRQIVGQKEI